MSIWSNATTDSSLFVIQFSNKFCFLRCLITKQVGAEISKPINFCKILGFNDGREVFDLCITMHLPEKYSKLLRKFYPWKFCTLWARNPPTFTIPALNYQDMLTEPRTNVDSTWFPVWGISKCDCCQLISVMQCVSWCCQHLSNL